jgi:hypothetical protein
MKLRLQSNSIRLRLKRSEVEQLARTGRVEEQIVFGAGSETSLTYVLETSTAVKDLTANLKAGRIIVQVPVETARRWATSNEVGLERVQPTGDEFGLHLLIEKDFACLNGTTEQNADTFPNPLAGTKC